MKQDAFQQIWQSLCSAELEAGLSFDLDKEKLETWHTAIFEVYKKKRELWQYRRTIAMAVSEAILEMQEEMSEKIITNEDYEKELTKQLTKEIPLKRKVKQYGRTRH